MWWCAMTYAVPGVRGPAQEPITAETDSTPRIASDSKVSSMRSAALLVSSRVRSTALRSSTSLSRRSSSACRARSAGLREPTFGGISVMSGPSTLPRPSIHSSQCSTASASFAENFAICSRRAALSSGQLEVAAVDARREVRALRVDVVAVPDEVEVAHQRGRQPGDDVRQARHGEVGAERLLADGGAADDVPALEHEGPQALAGEVGRGDQAVVPAADDDDVVVLGHARTSAVY